MMFESRKEVLNGVWRMQELSFQQPRGSASWMGGSTSGLTQD
jgi:hypothetical protein